MADMKACRSATYASADCHGCFQNGSTESCKD